MRNGLGELLNLEENEVSQFESISSKALGSMPSSSTATPTIRTPIDVAASAAVENVYSSVRTEMLGWKNILSTMSRPEVDPTVRVLDQSAYGGLWMSSVCKKEVSMKSV